MRRAGALAMAAALAAGCAAPLAPRPDLRPISRGFLAEPADAAEREIEAYLAGLAPARAAGPRQGEARIGESLLLRWRREKDRAVRFEIQDPRGSLGREQERAVGLLREWMVINDVTVSDVPPSAFEVEGYPSSEGLDHEVLTAAREALRARGFTEQRWHAGMQAGWYGCARPGEEPGWVLWAEFDCRDETDAATGGIEHVDRIWRLEVSRLGVPFASEQENEILGEALGRPLH